MAKTKQLFVLVGALIAVFVVFLFVSGQDYSPYDNKENKYARYEPFGPTDDDSASLSQPDVSSPSPSPSPTKQTPTEKPNNVAGGLMSNAMKMFGVEGFEPMVDLPKSIQYAPY
jgi:hypothetical protein